jgi:hypothetical protein
LMACVELGRTFLVRLIPMLFSSKQQRVAKATTNYGN